MAPREDLVASAVGFLQDPSVASSPLEKKIEFLKSKNLTQEEIDMSLAQAAGDHQMPPNAPYYPPQAYQRPPGYNYGYPPPGQWQQPPIEPPRRDWRDWFIMATVVSGAGYGLYTLAQRYVKPLIAPPTPPQLEQDKAAIDEQFNRAFTLLDTLAADTTALKEAEEARTKKLDGAITDIEAIVNELKTANQKREDDARRMETEVRNMKDSLPRALDSVREGSERQLKELSTELASLKLLMGNRMGNANSSFFPSGGQGLNSRPGPEGTRSAATGTPQTESVTGNKSSVTTSVNGAANTGSQFQTSSASFPSSSSPATPAATSSTTRPNFGTNKASIPAWQMAAQNKAKETASSAGSSTAAAATSGPTANGTASSVAAQQDGAEVVNILNS